MRLEKRGCHFVLFFVVVWLALESKWVVVLQCYSMVQVGGLSSLGALQIRNNAMHKMLTTSIVGFGEKRPLLFVAGTVNCEKGDAKLH